LAAAAERHRSLPSRQLELASEMVDHPKFRAIPGYRVGHFDHQRPVLPAAERDTALLGPVRVAGFGG